MDSLIKFIGINICVTYSFLKIIDHNKISLKKRLLYLISCISLALFQCFLQPYTPLVLRIFIIYFTYSVFFSIILKIKLGNAIFIVTISYALSYISFFLSLWIILFFMKFNTFNIVFNDTSIILISAFISIFLIYNLFKIQRLKHGVPYIKNKTNNRYIDISILVLNALIIFMYFLISCFLDISIVHLIFGFITLVLVMFIILQKTFILYQKQKLQTQTLKDYESQLAETQQKLTTALAEKQTLIKSNHEFYHRQEAIKKKLEDLSKQYSINYNTEFAQELGNLSDRINKLSDEYAIKTNFTPTLVKCNIEEIDDMLSYMKSECDNNNIEFILKIDCDINYIIDNFISKSQLETLLGDLIRNSIIAVNHNSGDYKSIMLIFGIKDSIYELCILDSGIPFEVNTLINLGLSPASTHLDEGGTGIGFLTTFETLNSCNASITINENTKNNYSKSIEIQFDNQNEYRLITNRKDKILENNVNNREIKIIE